MTIEFMHVPEGAGATYHLRSGGHQPLQMEPVYRTPSRCSSRGAAAASGSSGAQLPILPEPFFTPTVTFCVAVCVWGGIDELPGTVTFWA